MFGELDMEKALGLLGVATQAIRCANERIADLESRLSSERATGLRLLDRLTKLEIERNSSVVDLAHMSTSFVSPLTEARDARQVAIDDVMKSINASNAAERSHYAAKVLAWRINKEQSLAGAKLPPIPVPPASWIAVPIIDVLDSAFPGQLEPMVEDQQIGPPVAEQYVEPGAPKQPEPGTTVHVGPYMRDGEWSAMPDDNMPDGFTTKTPDGIWLRKVIEPTPWGKAQYYTSQPLKP